MAARRIASRLGAVRLAVWKLAVAVIDRDLVPHADVDRVGGGEIRYAILVERDLADADSP